MKYILMMNTQKGPYQHDTWPEKDWKAHIAYWQTLNAQLRASGELVSVEALTAPDQAKRVRAGTDGKPITDGVHHFAHFEWHVERLAAWAGRRRGLGGDRVRALRVFDVDDPAMFRPERAVRMTRATPPSPLSR